MMMHDKGLFISNCDEYVIDLSCLSPQKQAEIYAARMKIEESESESESEPSGKRTMLPEVAMERFSALERKASIGVRLDDEEAKWFQYASVLNGIELSEHKTRKINDKKLFSDIKERCRRDHLSETLASVIVPLIITHAQGKALKPIIFHGPAGCGKTFFASLFAEYLELPIVKISAPRAEYAHGYQGESRTFKNPDSGEIMHGIVETGKADNLFFIDEIDKAAENPDTRVRQQDELLTIISDMVVKENFMEFSLDISNSVFVFAINDLSVLSKPFIDRCMVIEFKETEQEKMNEILRDYVVSELIPFYAKKVRLDEETIYNASRKLYSMGITSIRQHEKQVDEGFRPAYTRCLYSTTSRPVMVSASDFDMALKVVHTGNELQRHIGF